MAKQKILVVDDHQNIRDVVKFALDKEGFSVVEAEDGKAALVAAGREQPDLIVLDIVMPEMNGTDVCREIRKTSDVPIIFLSSKDEELDRILGLELGGDDYITKPFSPRELVVRIKVVLRRLDKCVAKSTEVAGKEDLTSGSLRLDPVEYRAFWGEDEIVLTVTEFNLLSIFLGYPGKVYSRDELIDRAYEGVSVSHRTVDSHIRRIRSKLAKHGGDPIETVHGVGYKIKRTS